LSVKKGDKGKISVGLIVKDIIRGIFIHEHEGDSILNELGINSKGRSHIREFSERLKQFTNELLDKAMRLIDVIAISIPNGLLKEKYINDFVSEKDHGESVRYHYREGGIFKFVKKATSEEIPRALLFNFCEEYKSALREKISGIKILDYQFRDL